MGKRGSTIWWLAARVFLVPVFAWLLAAQSIILPLAKAQAANRIGGDAALAILCSSTLPGADDTDQGLPRQVHDLGCCTLSSRLDLDVPVAIPAAPEPLTAPAQAEQPIRYTLPQTRAPPAILASTARARAPPAHT